jgi:hypothetical protein
MDTRGTILKDLNVRVIRETASLTKNGYVTTGIEYGEMADGSGRTYAAVRWIGHDDEERTTRFIAPAPPYAPAWARKDHHTWQTVGA